MKAAMLVKNTFLELYPDTAAAAHQPRRRSMPPTCREGTPARDEAVDECIKAQLRRLERAWFGGTLMDLPIKKRSPGDCAAPSCASTCGDFEGSPVGYDFSRVTTADGVVEVEPEGCEDLDADAAMSQMMSPPRGSDADEDFPAVRFGGAPLAGGVKTEIVGAAERRARRRRRAARKAVTASTPESEEPPSEPTPAATRSVRVVPPAVAIPPPPPAMALAPRIGAKPGLRVGSWGATDLPRGDARGVVWVPAAGPPEVFVPPASAGDAGEDVADLQDLLALVPIDDQGRLTSIGAMEHAAGTCKPCIFFASPVACKFGVRCTFCHFPVVHTRTRVRFCKGKRERCRKLLGMEGSASASTDAAMRADITA